MDKPVPAAERRPSAARLLPALRARLAAAGHVPGGTGCQPDGGRLPGLNGAGSDSSGLALALSVLVARYLRMDVADPDWPDRDRLVIDPALPALPAALESLLGLPPGRFAAGGPPVGLAAGLAFAERRLAQRFGRSLVDHRIWAVLAPESLGSGASLEAARLAGRLGLSRLVAITAVAGAEATALSAMAALGWAVRRVPDGDAGAIASAVSAAVRAHRPSLIACAAEPGAPDWDAASADAAAEFDPVAANHVAVDHVAAPGDPLAGDAAGVRRGVGRRDAAADEGAVSLEESVAAWLAASRRGLGVRRAWLKRRARHGSRAEFEAAMHGRLPIGWHQALVALPLLGEATQPLPDIVMEAMRRAAMLAPELTMLPEAVLRSLTLAAAPAAGGPRQEAACDAPRGGALPATGSLPAACGSVDAPSAVAETPDGGAAAGQPRAASRAGMSLDAGGTAGDAGGASGRSAGPTAPSLGGLSPGMPGWHPGRSSSTPDRFACWLAACSTQGLSGLAAGMAGHGGVLPVLWVQAEEALLVEPALRQAALESRRLVVLLCGAEAAGTGRLEMLRALPFLLLFRPADASETLECLEVALRHAGPALVMLPSGATELLSERPSRTRCTRGGYVLVEAIGERGATLIASGAEIPLVLLAQEKLADAGLETAVVSLPCWPLFLRQEKVWREAVLDCAPRIAIERGSGHGWAQFLGADGLYLGEQAVAAPLWEPGRREDAAARLTEIVLRHAERRRAVWTAPEASTKTPRVERYR